LVRAQIYDLQFDAVLHFAEAKVIEKRPPLFVAFEIEIFGNVSGREECVRRRRSPSPVAPY
jgi:hypothetical protein